MPFDSTGFVEAPVVHPRHAEIAIVEEMQRILATPDRWCQGKAEIVSRDGKVSRCLMSALNDSYLDAVQRMWLPGTTIQSVFKGLQKITGFDSIPLYNDTHTHADVVGALARLRDSFVRELTSPA